MVESWVEDAFERGVPSSQFELHLQPIVDLHSHRLLGAESFVRWCHPERGVVPALAWIPHAGSIGHLAHYASALVPSWVDAARSTELTISFNASDVQLVDSGFIELLGEARPGRGTLALEIHHGQFQPFLADDPDPTRAAIADLDGLIREVRALGIEVWLDDFGEQPFGDDAILDHPELDAVKLDRSALAWAPERLAEVVERVHRRGGRVILEGIETDRHLAVARAARVDAGQGFHLGFGIPVGRFVARAVSADPAPR